MEGQSYIVSAEGDKIVIALSGKGDTPREMTLSFEEARALAMTLPRLLTIAMSGKIADPTARHVYPVQGYTVECASDLRHILLTLLCSGGFDVAFGFDANMVPTLMRDLAGGLALLEPPSCPRPN